LVGARADHGGCAACYDCAWAKHPGASTISNESFGGDGLNANTRHGSGGSGGGTRISIGIVVSIQ